MPPKPEALLPLISTMRTDIFWSRTPGKHPGRKDAEFTLDKITRHLDPDRPDYGLAFMLPGSSTTRAALLDFDSHGGELDFDAMRDVAMLVVDELVLRGLSPVPFRSSGGRGIHLWVIWDTPQDAYSVRKCLASVLAACNLVPGTKGVIAGEVEVFPKQDRVPSDRYGNMAILPLAGRSVPLDAEMSPLPRDALFAWVTSAEVPFLEHTVDELVVATPTVELERLRSALMAIPQDTRPLDYDQWRNVIFAIHHAAGDDGLALAHEFSARSTKYDQDFLDNRVWPYIRDDREGGITDKYILGLAGEYGYNPTTADDFEDLGDPEPEYPIAEKNKRTRFPAVPLGEFARHKVETHWLIKGILPAEGLAVVYGASGSGKTFMVLDMALSVCLGISWRGLTVHQGGAVYVCAEGKNGFRKRARAYAQQNGLDIDSIGMHVIADAPSLLDKTDVADLIASIATCGPVKVVVLDTLAQVTAGANENSGEDMGRALKAAQAVSKYFGCLVLLVHHSGKDETRGARGWSGIKGALDAELEVTRAEHDRVLSVTKQKDGEEGQEFGFTLLEIPLHGEEDEDGSPITSCVVVPADATKRQISRRKALSPEQQMIRDIVLAMDAPAGIDDIIAMVIKSNEGKPIRASSVKRSVTRMVETGVLLEVDGKIRDSSYVGGKDRV